MKRVLVVDDDRASCELLREIFVSQDWLVDTALTPDEALQKAQLDNFDLVVSDINLEAEKNGLDLLKELRGQCPVILVTAFGSLDSAVTASREGAWDFISKPFKVEEVIAVAQQALNQTRASRDQDEVAPLPASLSYENMGLIGRSPAMIELYKAIARVAPTKATVLIVGDSGTGKELVARAIHKHSPRANHPFVPVNCGALTETLLEAELFGHVRGAFTGAASDRKGLWAEADGGTLFLDEIGETSSAMQVKLLRALQEGEIRRVGASKTERIDTRVIAATNRNLEKEVKSGSFREDLFYRLSVVTLRVPPLRERRTDIPLLADRFLMLASERVERGPFRITEEAIRTLVAYDWPGNVRELESAVEHATLRARGKEITPHDLPEKFQSADLRDAAQSPLTTLYGDLPSLAEVERRYLIYVLDSLSGNRSRAAEVMGIDRRTLYRMAERYGIDLSGE
ncbi:MAG: two-component system response regulator [Blastocatellia bacterium]|nr:MAG: two-component system response regulator [Blastocatellia bacterium]